MAARSSLLRGLRWQVGTGESIRIWNDPWLPDQNGFRVLSPRQAMGSELVASLIDQDTKQWRLELVNQLFMPSEAAQILSIPISYKPLEDRLLWHYSKDGIYSVKSAYSTARSSSNNQKGTSCQIGGRPCKKIWACKIPNKIKHFLWRALKGVLPVNEAVQGRGLQVPLDCIFCGVCVESVTHALLTCERALKIWFLSPLGVRITMGEQFSFENWFWEIMEHAETEAVEMVCMVAWSIWNSRNCRIYKGESRAPATVLGKALNLLQEYKRETGLQTSIRAEVSSDLWQPPAIGFLKINTDITWCDEGIGVGMVCRDNKGSPIFLLAKYLPGKFVIEVAELMTIRDAAQEAADRSMAKIIVEADSSTAVQRIHSRQQCWTAMGILAADIHTISQSFSSFTATFSGRHTNAVAHALVKLAPAYPTEMLSSVSY